MKILGLDVTIWFVIILLIVLAVIPARIARGKGYSYWGFYLFGLVFFFPAFIVALILPKHVDNTATELASYKKLLDDGVITQEEFDKKKKELLG